MLLVHGEHWLGSKDIAVGHNDDGSFPGRYVEIYAHSYIVEGTAGGNLSANTIQRASQPSCVTYPNNTENVGPIGGSFYIHMNRKSSAFTHTVRYSWANRTGTIATNVTDNYYWTIPNDFASSIPNSNSGWGMILVDTYSGGTFIGTKSCKFVCNVTDANPIFTNFNFEDVNQTTIALTGNNQKLIKNYSDLQVMVTSSNKAVAKKYATMNKYRATNGTLSKDMSYSSTNNVSSILGKAESGVINIYAIDSRNNSTLAIKNATEFINYTPLQKGNISVTRQNGISETVTLSFSGNIDLIDFGDVTNSIKQAKYRYKSTDSSTWSQYEDITLTVDNNGEFSYNEYVQGDLLNYGFDINNSYNFEVYVEDELSNVTFTANLNSGIPNIALHKNGVSIMGKYDETEGGEFQVKGKKVLQPYTLYENSGGTNGTVTLSDSVANYDYIEIYVLSTSDYGTGYAQNSTKVWQPNGKTAWLTTGYCDTNNYNLKVCSALLQNNTITRPYGYWEFSDSSSSQTNYIGITKVIGYK